VKGRRAIAKARVPAASGSLAIAKANVATAMGTFAGTVAALAGAIAALAAALARLLFAVANVPGRSTKLANALPSLAHRIARLVFARAAPAIVEAVSTASHDVRVRSLAARLGTLAGRSGPCLGARRRQRLADGQDARAHLSRAEAKRDVGRVYARANCARRRGARALGSAATELCGARVDLGHPGCSGPGDTIDACLAALSRVAGARWAAFVVREEEAAGCGRRRRAGPRRATGGEKHRRERVSRPPSKNGCAPRATGRTRFREHR
jgi:hypothetical protein